MRTALLLSALSLVSVLGIACSDSSAGSDLSRRYNAQGREDPNAPHDPSADDIGTDPDPNPGGTSQPGQPSNPGTAAATFDVAVSNATPQTDLGTSITFDVTVTPKAAFTGAVTLAATGLPTGVTATFAPAAVNIAGAGPMTSKITLAVPYEAPVTPKAAPVALVITASYGGASATANVNFKVNAQMTMSIPMNSAALRSTQTVYRDQWGDAFGAAPKALTTQADNPITVIVKNADSVPQEVHSGATFRHGSGLVQPGQVDPVARSLKVGNNVNGYLHNDGATQGDGKGVSFQIVVNP